MPFIAEKNPYPPLGKLIQQDTSDRYRWSFKNYSVNLGQMNHFQFICPNYKIIILIGAFAMLCDYNCPKPHYYLPL